MSLPGLGLAAPPSSTQQRSPQNNETRTITLSANSEWRFEISPNSSISLKLLPPAPTNNNSNSSNPTFNGTAEIFGTELAPNHTYEFPALTKAALFTHYGCAFTVTGSCESDYTAEETIMTEYTNLHFGLENLRANAFLEGTRGMGGPRVLVVGPKDSGKSSLVKLLTAYATRSGRTPLVVNLDPGEGFLTLPGSISAAVMGTGAVLDVEDAAAGGGWGSSPIGGPSAVPVKTPLVYHVGYKGPEERGEVFGAVAGRLAVAVTSRFEEDEAVRKAGLLVDLAGSVCGSKAGLEVVAHVVSEFSINVFLVLGSERLYSDLFKRFGPTSTSNPTDEPIQILRLPRSGGCVDRDETYMRQLRHAQIRAYFFGSPRGTTLSPHTLSVGFDDFKVLKMVNPTSSEEEDDFSNLLPGDDDEYDPSPDSTEKALFTPVIPSLALQSALLALKRIDPRSGGQEAIRDAPVVGYVYVVDIEEARKRVKVLSPVGGALPRGCVLIWGVWDRGLAFGVGGLVGD